MDELVVDNMNSYMKKEDRVIYGGDLLFGMDKLINLQKLMNRLVCRNWIYILGNHDDWMYKPANKAIVKEILGTELLDEYRFNYKGKDILVRHYSPEEWDVLKGNAASHNTERRFKNLDFVRDPNLIYFYGHEHNADPSRKMDIGIDTEHSGHKKYTPYLLDEAIDIYSARTK